MIKMEIVLDKDKLNKYKLNEKDVIKSLDDIFDKYNFKKIEDGVYQQPIGQEDLNDASFALDELEAIEGLMDSCKKWLWTVGNEVDDILLENGIVAYGA